MIKVEDHINKIGLKERMRLLSQGYHYNGSAQWGFQPALENVMNDTVNFILLNLKIPTSIGWKTSKTGVFPDSFGGDMNSSLFLRKRKRRFCSIQYG